MFVVDRADEPDATSKTVAQTPSSGRPGSNSSATEILQASPENKGAAPPLQPTIPGPGLHEIVTVQTIASRHRALMAILMGKVTVLMVGLWLFAWKDWTWGDLMARHPIALIALSGVDIALSLCLLWVIPSLFRALGESVAESVVAGLLMFVPILGIVVLVRVGGLTNKALRRMGFRVGLLGVAPEKVLRRFEESS